MILINRIAGAALWSIASNLSVSATSVITYFVYARFLQPEDLGVVAFCTLWVSFIRMFVEDSLSFALIQDQTGDVKVFNVAFFTAAGASIVGFGLLIAASNLIAATLHDPRVVPVVSALAVLLICGGLSSTHIALCQRRFEFGKLFYIRLMSTCASAACGIGLAVSGRGYWALVGAAVAGGITQLIASWSLVSWRPGFEISWEVAAPLYRFVGWVSLDLSTAWLAMWSGVLFLGYFLGPHEVGLYRFGDQISNMVIGVLLSPVATVFYSAFCRAAKDKEELGRLFNLEGAVIGIVAPFMAAALVVVAHPIELLIGDQWNGIGEIIVLSAVFVGIGFLHYPVPGLLRAQNRADLVAVMRLILVAAQIILYVVSAPYGLIVVLWSAIGLEFIMYAVSLSFVRMASGIDVAPLFLRQLRSVVLTFLSVVPAIWLGAMVSKTMPLQGLIVAVLVFGSLYAIFLFLAERETLLQLLRMLGIGSRTGETGTSLRCER